LILLALMSTQDEKKGKICYRAIPPGTPYSVLAEATNRFNVELAEKEVMIPEVADSNVTPRAWILKGEKEELMKAEEFIYNKMLKMLEKFK
jgi:hypothetical protein